MNVTSQIAFSNQGPFFPRVATFRLVTTGLGPLYQSDHPLHLSERDRISYHGRVEPQLDVDLEPLRRMTPHLELATAVQQVSGMLIISTHAVALECVGNDLTILRRPEMKFCRHVRNAAAHGNRFHFAATEPRRPASWRRLALDRATHQDAPCWGTLLNAADALLLLSDIEQIRPAAAHPSAIP